MPGCFRSKNTTCYLPGISVAELCEELPWPGLRPDLSPLDSHTIHPPERETDQIIIIIKKVVVLASINIVQTSGLGRKGIGTCRSFSLSRMLRP